MKTALTIFIALTLVVLSSCKITKQSTDNSISKERMELDAYALALIDCEYKMAVMEKNNNPGNKQIANNLDQIKSLLAKYSRSIKEQYIPSNQVKDVYTLSNTLKNQLSTCKKLEEEVTKLNDSINANK